MNAAHTASEIGRGHVAQPGVRSAPQPLTPPNKPRAEATSDRQIATSATVMAGHNHLTLPRFSRAQARTRCERGGCFSPRDPVHYVCLPWAPEMRNASAQ